MQQIDIRIIVSYARRTDLNEMFSSAYWPRYDQTSQEDSAFFSVSDHVETKLDKGYSGVVYC